LDTPESIFRICEKRNKGRCPHQYCLSEDESQIRVPSYREHTLES
jgi:hypothetical protein